MIDETLFLNIDDFITKYDYWSSKVQFINVQHRDEKIIHKTVQRKTIQ